MIINDDNGNSNDDGGGGGGGEDDDDDDDGDGGDDDDHDDHDHDHDDDDDHDHGDVDGDVYQWSRKCTRHTPMTLFSIGAIYGGVSCTLMGTIFAIIPIIRQGVIMTPMRLPWIELLFCWGIRRIAVRLLHR